MVTAGKYAHNRGQFIPAVWASKIHIAQLATHHINQIIFLTRNRIISVLCKFDTRDNPPMADAAAKDETNTPSLIEIVRDEMEVMFNSGATQATLDDVKVPNVFEQVKEAVVETVYTHRDEITGEVENKFNLIAADTTGNDKTSELIKKETHGTSNDIGEDTPLNAVKAPNVFQRAKEELEALVQTVQPMKEPSPEREGGFRQFIAKVLQAICHPRGLKKD